MKKTQLEEEESHMEVVTDVELHRCSEWKRAADAQLDSEDLAANIPLGTTRKRGASGFNGLDPMLDRTSEDLKRGRELCG